MQTRATTIPLVIACASLAVVALVTGAGPREVTLSATDPTTTAAVATSGTAAAPSTSVAPTTTVPSNVGAQPTGEFLVVPGTGPVVGSGDLVRYRVEIETGLTLDASAFAAVVDATLADPRSWSAAGDVSVQRVDADADVVLVVATPATTDRLCRPLQTNGIFSCHNGGRVVLNVNRWEHGSSDSPLPISEYRAYMVNHEFGHALGHGHVGCPAAGAVAPVMMQQTKGLEGCVPNAWPYP